MTEETKDNNQNQDEPVLKEILRFLGSMKAGLILLIILAIVSVFGSLIPQQRDPGFYQENYSEMVANIAIRLGLDNVFEVWWFVGLIGLLCANLFLCSLSRLPGIWKKAFQPEKTTTEKSVTQLSNSSITTIEKPESATAEKVIKVLKKFRYKTEIQENETGEKVVFAEKGRFGYFGSFLTHLSIVILVLGFTYGNMVGYEDFVFGIPGDVVDIEQEEFQIQIDDFEIDYREDYSVDQYYSTLTVLEDEEEVKQERIHVNNPLRYSGVSLYQSTHGWMGEVDITDHNTGFEDNAILWEESHRHVQGRDKAVFLHSFFPDYDLGPEGPRNRSPIPNNPRFIWMLYEGNELVDMYVTEPGEPIEHEGLEVTFSDYHEYTGLRVVHDPGVPVFFVGSIIMVLGLILSFYLYPKRIWAIIRTSNETAKEGNQETSKVIIGGRGLKDRSSFQHEFNDIIDKMFQEVE